MSPIKKVRQITAWSISRLQDWETCPRKAKHKHVERIKEPGNKAMERGSEIHKEAECYILGKTRKLPKSLKRFEIEFKELRKINKVVKTEESLTVRDDWTQTTWDDWDGAWLRAKVDAMYIDPDDPTRLIMIDFKTGRPRPDKHRDQLSLYAAIAFQLFFGIEVVDSELWYLDEGEIASERFTRAQAEQLRKTWEKKAKPMLTDKTFKAKPSSACAWCFYGQAGKAKGGPGCCEF